MPPSLPGDFSMPKVEHCWDRMWLLPALWGRAWVTPLVLGYQSGIGDQWLPPPLWIFLLRNQPLFFFKVLYTQLQEANRKSKPSYLGGFSIIVPGRLWLEAEV